MHHCDTTLALKSFFNTYLNRSWYWQLRCNFNYKEKNYHSTLIMIFWIFSPSSFTKFLQTATVTFCTENKVTTFIMTSRWLTLYLKLAYPSQKDILRSDLRLLCLKENTEHCKVHYFNSRTLKPVISNTNQIVVWTKRAFWNKVTCLKFKGSSSLQGQRLLALFCMVHTVTESTAVVLKPVGRLKIRQMLLFWVMTVFHH